MRRCTLFLAYRFDVVVPCCNGSIPGVEVSCIELLATRTGYVELALVGLSDYRRCAALTRLQVF